ncbi:MAG: hypothetical protein V2J89_01350 [Halieaceae bacterium]|jgi:tetratricopeptide (TPR) repeat protein|nr:hypothetical protein [Halieaceae bacterium]
MISPAVGASLLVAIILVALPLCSFAALDNDTVPTAYGVRFYTADAAVPLPLPPRQAAPEADLWLQRIRDKTYASGPYGPGIAEVVEDAGRYFFSRGDFGTAIEQWRQAVHLLRVNDGLYSPRQLPLLERLGETYRALGDYESAGEIESYLLFLSRKHHSEGDPQRLAASLRWLDWQRREWLRDPDITQPRILLQQWREVRDIVRAREADDSPLPPLSLAEQEALVQAQLRVLLLISATDFGLDRQADLLMGPRFGERPDVLTMEQTQIRNLQESAYSRGRSRLEDLLARQREAGEVAAEARTLLALGDWHQWYDSPQRASEAYTQTWQLLSRSGDTATRDQWFAAPVELPANGAFWAGPGSYREYSSQTVVAARFTVTERGRVSELETEALAEENAGVASRLYRRIRDMRFRPRLSDGEPVAVAVTRRYRAD